MLFYKTQFLLSCSMHIILIPRNPSIEGDTPFRSCTSPSKIYCHEISNNLSASITTDILEQTHYSTWWEIESSYRNCLTWATDTIVTLSDLNTMNMFNLTQTSVMDFDIYSKLLSAVFIECHFIYAIELMTFANLRNVY